MNTRANSHKLAELSAKTDSQLHTLISRYLDRGLVFARLLSDEEARQQWASLEEFSANAEDAYAEVSRLLPLLRCIPAAERRKLQSRHNRLRELLDCATFCAVPRVQSAAML